METGAQPATKRTTGQWLGIGAVLLLVSLASYALFTYAMSREPAADVAAYWNAAERLRSGQPLYEPGAANASDLYRYSPWFAAAWVPLTFLPREWVEAGWVLAMVAAALASTVPLLVRGPAGWAAFLLLTPLQLQGAVFGNVQPLLVLALVLGIDRRAAPLVVAMAASLKAVPLIVVVVWLARGEWRRAGLTLALTAILVLPAFLFDLSGYSTEPGPNQLSLAGVWLPLFFAGAAASLLAIWVLARTRWAWLAAGTAMIACLPRLLTYEIGFVLVGLVGRSPSAGSGRAELEGGSRYRLYR